MATKRVAIVGAGMGGLAAAIRLRLTGLDVEVFEKNGQPGGRVGRLRESGFTFDTGPTLLLMTDVYRDLFAAADRNLDEEIDLVNLDPNYQVHFGDGDSIRVSSSLGLSPFEAPAVYALLPYTELAEDGLWFPRGGMYELVEAMVRLARDLGVRINLNSPVEEIVVTKDQARGVRVNGEEIGTDAVLANADLPYVYRKLLPRSAGEGDFRWKLRKREKLLYTASSFMLYLGLDRKLDHLSHHNVYLSTRYRENFEQIFSERRLPNEPSFYTNVPSRTDENAAPAGMESLYVLVPTPHLNENVDWKRESPAFKERVYDLLEEKAGIEDIRRHVVYEKVKTPLDWLSDYNLEEGAAFGIGHGIFQVGFFRPPIASKTVRGVYFVGASTRPGTGVPLVTIGAKLAAERIGRDLGGRPLATPKATTGVS
ncbi:MAG: phytoene desaturase [Actinobacteria bacterium]|nr:phytoene desaturase [Actinomycetota bacterium]